MKNLMYVLLLSLSLTLVLPASAGTTGDRVTLYKGTQSECVQIIEMSEAAINLRVMKKANKAQSQFKHFRKKSFFIRRIVNAVSSKFFQIRRNFNNHGDHPWLILQDGLPQKATTLADSDFNAPEVQGTIREIEEKVARYNNYDNDILRLHYKAAILEEKIALMERELANGEEPHSISLPVPDAVKFEKGKNPQIIYKVDTFEETQWLIDEIATLKANLASVLKSADLADYRSIEGRHLGQYKLWWELGSVVKEFTKKDGSLNDLIEGSENLTAREEFWMSVRRAYYSDNYRADFRYAAKYLKSLKSAEFAHSKGKDDSYSSEGKEANEELTYQDRSDLNIDNMRTSSVIRKIRGVVFSSVAVLFIWNQFGEDLSDFKRVHLQADSTMTEISYIPDEAQYLLSTEEFMNTRFGEAWENYPRVANEEIAEVLEEFKNKRMIFNLSVVNRVTKLNELQALSEESKEKVQLTRELFNAALLPTQSQQRVELNKLLIGKTAYERQLVRSAFNHTKDVVSSARSTSANVEELYLENFAITLSILFGTDNVDEYEKAQ